MKVGTIKECVYCQKDFEYGGRSQKWCPPCIKDIPEHVRRSSTVKGRVSKLLWMAKNRAKTKNLEFDLTVDYLLELWENQAGVCVISGRAFQLGMVSKHRQVNPDAPSIDRIIPERGYTKGNVRFLTYHTNVCVNEYGDEVLVKLLEDILAQRGRR